MDRRLRRRHCSESLRNATDLAPCADAIAARMVEGSDPEPVEALRASLTTAWADLSADQSSSP
jgi:hypothetical protein